MHLGGNTLHIVSSSVHQIIFAHLPLPLPLNSLLCSMLPRSSLEGVTMYSWLVTVLLLASAANGSGGQGADGQRWDGGLLVCIRFPPQVYKCPSQATHVHNLTYQALMIRDGAQSVVDL